MQCCCDERVESARYILWKQIGIFARTQGKHQHPSCAPKKHTVGCNVSGPWHKSFCWCFKTFWFGEMNYTGQSVNLNGITEWGLYEKAIVVLSPYFKPVCCETCHFSFSCYYLTKELKERKGEVKLEKDLKFAKEKEHVHNNVYIVYALYIFFKHKM